MVRALIMLAVLASVETFACPNLAGDYSCTDNNGSKSRMSVSQSTDQNTGVTTYIVNGQNVPADDIAHSLPDDSNMKMGSMRSWCKDDVFLHSEVKGKLYQGDGSFYGDLNATFSISMVGRDQKVVMQGTIKSSNGSSPVSGTTLCTAN